jgi:Leucine-rich repeat (LRR) protein
MKNSLFLLAAACLACAGCFDNWSRPADVITVTSLDALAQTNRAEVVRLFLRGAPRPVTDADFEGLSDSKLQQLDLSELNLDKVPAKVWGLKGLTSFWFVRNKLAAIPDEVAQLPELTYLNLDGNAITTVPDWVGTALPKLKSLSLKGCPITRLPDDISGLRGLTTLNVADCPFSSAEVERVRAALGDNVVILF